MKSSRFACRARPARAGGAAPFAARVDWRYLCFVQLRVCGLALTAVLLSWGVAVLALAALGGFTLDGVMAQLGNLAARYLAADAGRRAQFAQLLGGAQLLLIALIALLRLPRLARDLGRGERP